MRKGIIHILQINLVLWSPESSVGQESVRNAGDPCSTPGSGRSAEEGTGYPPQYPWASLVPQLVKNPPAMQETWVPSQVGKIPWRSERLPTPVFWPEEVHGLYSPWGSKESNTDWETFTFTLWSPVIDWLNVKATESVLCPRNYHSQLPSFLTKGTQYIILQW